MTREEISEQAAAYALGGLEGAERARFEALLRAGDADVLAALRDFEDTLAGLAAAAPETPPAAVKAALMERIAAAPPAARAPAPVRPLPRRRSAIWPVVLSGAMAAGLAAVVVGWTVSATYEKRLDTLARDADQLKAELRGQQAVIAILRDPVTQVVALAGLPPAPGARARMMWHEKAGGVFVATGLPAPPEGKAYQLWAIAGSNAPVSAGVFSVDASGTGSLSVRPLPGVAAVNAFAVTLEPAGGLPAPSGEMYLLGKS
jgi:anti-sigma-K factor RskA